MTILFQRGAIVEVLKKHFDIDHEKATHEAHRLHRRLSLANMLETLENEARPPQKDIKGLQDAAKNLQRARSQINALGWYSKKELPSLRSMMDLPEFHTLFQMQSKKWTDYDELLALLETLQLELLSAAKAVNPDAEPPLSALSVDGENLKFKQAGGPKKTAKRLLADELAQTFWTFTGKVPKRSHDPVTGADTGRFLAFLTDTFSALSIRGNEEELARNACETFEPRPDDDIAPGPNAWTEEN